jgi:cytochrome c peroxidase
MSTGRRLSLLAATAALGFAAALPANPPDPRKPTGPDPLEPASLEWQVGDERLKLPFHQDRPITFVNRAQSPAEWDKLPAFWNEVTETAVDPRTGKSGERKAVKIKVPLGLTHNPPVPAENPLTVAKWQLGKRLYFDRALSADNSVSCASCHDPKFGYTDQAKFSTGIGGQLGGMNAPTVINSAYNLLQFWDGRAISLEDQAQGPVQNPVEMFAGDGNAWHKAVARVRSKSDYTARFKEVFGHEPTRDAIAKAVASYERTVLAANSVHDRAERAMQKRLKEDEDSPQTLTPADYETVLKDALARSDASAVGALKLDKPTPAQIADEAKSIDNGRKLFFNKARCSACHAGDNFTDNGFHNLGVGVDKEGRISADAQGRFARLPTGHKDPQHMGAFKTPTTRGLLATAPYMHDGSEQTLEEVVEFYDRGGNANEFLDSKMRDTDAEAAYLAAKAKGEPWKGPEVKVFGRDGRPVIPLKLNLTPAEKKDLVLFLRALQGDPVDAVVADPQHMPLPVADAGK